jgi:hypothetical protein
MESEEMRFTESKILRARNRPGRIGSRPQPNFAIHQMVSTRRPRSPALPQKRFPFDFRIAFQRQST